ncbi:hypothetical protein K439DRAFT_1617545 [Ramaria rubella]|nr:hypothetical protein K439DRAFT_1617545 [Ramaria rubella]
MRQAGSGSASHAFSPIHTACASALASSGCCTHLASHFTELYSCYFDEKAAISDQVTSNYYHITVESYNRRLLPRYHGGVHNVWCMGRPLTSNENDTLVGSGETEAEFTPEERTPHSWESEKRSRYSVPRRPSEVSNS